MEKKVLNTLAIITWKDRNAYEITQIMVCNGGQPNILQSLTECLGSFVCDSQEFVWILKVGALC